MKMKKIRGIKLNNGGHQNKSAFVGTNEKVILDSIVKFNPRYLAKGNPVMFTVELGFIVVLAIGLFPANSISSEFVTQNRIFYLVSAVILILTVWFATFSESLSEAQARARVDSLKSLEKEVSAHKIVNDEKEVTEKSC